MFQNKLHYTTKGDEKYKLKFICYGDIINTVCRMKLKEIYETEGFYAGKRRFKKYCDYSSR